MLICTVAHRRTSSARNHRNPALLSLFVLLIFFPHRPLSAQEWIVFTNNNSPIPNGSLSDLFVDNVGNYWIAVDGWKTGTQGGIVRFDGFHWSIFNTSNSPFPNERITSVAVQQNGFVWASVLGVPLMCFDGILWKSFNRATIGIPDSIIFNITVEGDSLVWLLNFTNGVTRYDGFTFDWMMHENDKRWPIDYKNLWPIGYANFLYVDKRGYRWVGSDDGGLVRFNGTSWKQVFKDSLLNPTLHFRVFGMAEEKNGTYWIVCNSPITYLTNLVAIKDTMLIPYTFHHRGNRWWSLFDGIAIDSNGNKWIGGTGLMKFDTSIVMVYDSINSPLGESPQVERISIDKHGNIVFLAIIKGGIEALVFFNEDRVKGIVTSVLTDHVVPKYFSLQQNYPNPFNPETKINYQLPVTSSVKLVVYDLLGREVARLVNKTLAEGTHTITWNSTNVGSGMYFYRLTAGNYSETKKMIVLR